jgi:biotin transport system substrate-specific component
MVFNIIGRGILSQKETSLRGMVYASMFGALTAVGAYIMIPLPPVPITLQTLFVNLAGALLGGYLGAGAGVLLGPTGGYLIGFVVGAFVIGKLTAIRKKPGLVWLICAMSMGIAVVYILGITQLMIVAKLDFEKVIAVGLLPPLPGDILKVIVAALICRKVRDHIRL